MNETNEQQQEDVFKLSEHGIPHESCREQYINSLIHQEIEMNLDIASDLAFNLLKDTDVDEDELEGLKYRFIQAKASLDCYEHAFDKLEKENCELSKSEASIRNYLKNCIKRHDAYKKLKEGLNEETNTKFKAKELLKEIMNKELN